MLVSARGVVDLNGRISEWLQLAARRMCALKHDACMCSRRPWYMRQCDCLTRPVNVLVLAMVCCEGKAVAVFFFPCDSSDMVRWDTSKTSTDAPDCSLLSTSINSRDHCICRALRPEDLEL
jgi:hypothetical protein